MMKFRWAALLPFLMCGAGGLAQDFQGACKNPSARFITSSGGCLDLEKGLVWGMASFRQMNLGEAKTYCAGLSEQGITGWVLPSRAQLSDLVDAKIAAEQFSFSLFAFFWANSQSNADGEWTINLKDGEQAYQSKTDFKARVLCVRRAFGCISEDSRFRTESGGCKDMRTSLVWSEFAPQKMSWPVAYRHCRALRQGKTEEWRLPLRTELLGIAGYDEAVAHLQSVPVGNIWGSYGSTEPRDFMPVADLRDTETNHRASQTGLYAFEFPQSVLCVH